MRREVLYTVTVINLSRQVWYKFTDASALKMDTNFVPKRRLILHIKRQLFFIIEEGLTKDNINVLQSRIDVKKIS